EKFTEIDVERINVVEPDGKYRLVISNTSRSIGPIYKGKPFGYAGGHRPGLIWFNDEGTENGGLGFGGSRNADGTFDASTHMSFDQFDNDQVLNFDYNERGGRRLVGISMLDRAPVRMDVLASMYDSLNRISDPQLRQKEMIKAMQLPNNTEPLAAQRVFLGRNQAKAATLLLSDRSGHPRIRLAVDSTGTPALEFLDDAGKVTSRLPEAKK
ncbi:MAG TPA: hypothetical protein VGL13_03455, partial [Polyangiaceae bacterium]